MLCPSCHIVRPENTAPCPQCFAPSPLVGGQGGGDYASFSPATWGEPMTSNSNGQWDNPVPPNGFQAHDNSLWAQVMAPQSMQGIQTQGAQNVSQNEQQATMLPVPYAGGQLPFPVMMSPDLTTIQLAENGGTGGALVPAPPNEEGTIYVPPMYTKPRPIIPRYRIISGFISFFVVIGLLCGGTAYYAKVTGRLTFLRQLYDPHFANIQSSQATPLPDPSAVATFGPAHSIINSATTASSIEPTTSEPRNPTNKFQVGDTIYVTYSVHAPKAGVVTFKWYMGNLIYVTKPFNIPYAKNGVSAYTTEIYARPAEGMVELYWNGQLAIQLHFVVEPNPNATNGL